MKQYIIKNLKKQLRLITFKLMESILKYKNIKIIYGICLKNRKKMFKSDNEIINKHKYNREFENYVFGGTITKKKQRSKSCFNLHYENQVDWNSISQNLICEFVNELINECIEVSTIRNQDVDSHPKTIFDIKKTIDFKEYFIVTALVLMDKFIYKSKIVPRKSNICLIIVTAIYISIKMNEDKIFKSKYLSDVFGVSLKKLSELEIQFLLDIKFRCFVKPNVQSFYSSCISEYVK